VLREDYALLTRAIPLLEAVDQVAQEREPNYPLYRMLTGALHTLVETRNPLVTPAFFWKLLSLEGFHPMLDACARCSEGDETNANGEHALIAFDLDEGGTICRACARGGGRPVTPEGLDLLRRVLGGGLNGVLTERPGPASHEIEHLGVRALEHHVERRMRSAVLL
jgi:DNA repair protein RecO (recombination protein O)